MSEKSRWTVSRKRAAYTARTDQRSDPKPKSRLARKLAKLTPPKTKIRGGIRNPNGAAYQLDAQKPFPFADAPEIARYEAQPFLKWAGGKASLLAQLDEFFPHEIERYIEPFLGGGAVFFHLKHRFPHMRAFLRDSNKELINAYRMVRDRPNELIELLDEHLKKFRSRGEDYYYTTRKQHDLTDDLARAARTIFLNKTCFNGLYRVNARGEFNTPVGSSKNPSLYDRENLLAASFALRDAQLEAEDVHQVVDEARRGDFVYLDPPYFPVSVYSDFKRYTAGQFHEADQVNLARIFRELDGNGCHVVLSNSEHPRVRELYAGYDINIVSAPRFINCKPGGRGNVAELVITNARAKTKAIVQAPSFAEPSFPDTKYMGSKQRLLPFIMKHISSLKFASVLDAFSGSGCVAYPS